MDAYLAATKQPYQPNFDAMKNSLLDLGESLHIAAVDLASDCTLVRIDLMVSRLKGAEASLVHLRKTLATEVPPDLKHLSVAARKPF